MFGSIKSYTHSENHLDLPIVPNMEKLRMLEALVPGMAKGELFDKLFVY